MSAEISLHPPDDHAHAADNTARSGSSSGSPIPDIATAPGDAATTSTSTSASDIHTERSLSASPTAASLSYDPRSSSSSLSAKPEVSSSAPSSMDSSATSSTLMDLEPDIQILEALRSKDRLYVLKLGEQMEALIKERRMRIDLTPSTTYQRLLVHRCSAYYKLSPETDPVTKGIYVYYRTESRIPIRRICELVPVEQSAQPAIQIMRRAPRLLRGRHYSHPGSTAGDDADTSDVDASEAGSVGGISNAASTNSRRFKTIEEREADYNEARSRIFMGFEDKKEKDMSANSSTFSLVSGSGSTSGGRGSSIGDLDDSASSAPTESEWSGPVTRDKWDGRRPAGSTTSSVRSLRSSGPAYANGSGSSRNSRATSPSFTYPTLYEPVSVPVYEQQPQYVGPPSQAPPPPGYGHYVYPPYNSPPLAPHSHGQPYMAPYYYPSYPYPPLPSGQPSDTTGGSEAMYPPSNPGQQPQYGQPYMWSTPSPPGQSAVPPPHMQPHHHAHPNIHSDGHSAIHPPPMHTVPQYPGPAPYGYSFPGYYSQPYQPGAPMAPPPPPPPPPMPGPMYHRGPPPESISSYPNANGMDISRTSSQNSSNNHSINGKRGGSRPRGAGTYGSGIGAGGSTFNPGGSLNGISANNDAYGPRLSIPMRRTSGTSSGGSAGARTPADETSSTASSSTTSSSSRRTFTSTSTSSKHPLPPRPDWAVGLKPQHPRHHDHHNNGNGVRVMSSGRLSGGPQQHQAPLLQSNDFPPLSSGPLTRQPAVGGAWTNASTSRVMKPGPQGHNTSQGTALVHYPTSQQSSPQVPSAPPPGSIMRLDEQDSTFERPPPKSAELFNPKSIGNGGRDENGRSRANTGASASCLVDRMGSLVLIDAEGMLGDVPSAEISSISPSNGDIMLGVAAGETVAASS